MPFIDPAEKAAVKMEIRRFVARCESNESLVQRADSLRELARLASTPLPYKIGSEPEARDALWRLTTAAQERAKELVSQQITVLMRTEADHRSGAKSRMIEDWGNLTGPLGHLRTWANSKLTAAEHAGT